MTSSATLWKQVHRNTSRDVIVRYLKSVAAEANQLGVDRLVVVGDYFAPGARFPRTYGEQVADNITYALASQDWIEGESKPALDELLGIVSQLVRNVGDASLWQVLLEKIEEV